MSEKETISNILDNYEDKERLRTILRVHKEGHISDDEALSLLTGDRNYYLTNTLKEIQNTLKNQITPWTTYVGSTTWSATPSVTYSYNDPAVGSTS